MTHTTHATQPTPDTHNTPETIPSIEDLREAITTHQKEACYMLERGLFFSAKAELDKCIVLTGQIGDKLVRGT